MRFKALVVSAEDVDVRNHNDGTPSHLATRSNHSNHAEAVGMLLSAGADSALKDPIEAPYVMF